MDSSKLSKYQNFKESNLNFKLGDTVAFALYPGKYFVEGGTDKNVDYSHKIYNEKSRKFVVNPNMMGTVSELFLKRNTNEVWAVLYNYYVDLYFSVPLYNILRVEVTA